MTFWHYRTPSEMVSKSCFNDDCFDTENENVCLPFACICPSRSFLTYIISHKILSEIFAITHPVRNNFFKLFQERYFFIQLMNKIFSKIVIFLEFTQFMQNKN